MVFPKRSSPPRRALHDRSDSQTNTIATPSIRLVEDSDVYATSPFPTQPLHVLSPNDGTTRVSGKPSTVSSPPSRAKPAPPSSQARAQVTTQTVWSAAKSRFAASNELEARGNAAFGRSPAEGLRISNLAAPGVVTQHEQRLTNQYTANVKDGSTAISTATQAKRLAPPANPFPVPVLSPSAYWKGGPASGSGSSGLDNATGGVVNRASNAEVGPHQQSWPAKNTGSGKALPADPASGSPASSASSDTFSGAIHRPKAGRPQASYSAFPPGHPAASPSPRSAQAGAKLTLKKLREQDTPPTPLSSSESTSSRSGSPSSSVQPSPAIRRGPQIQYPVIKKPSAQGSWANLGITIPRRRPRMISPRYARSRQWSTDLSTVASESDRTSTITSDRLSGYGAPQSQVASLDVLSQAGSVGHVVPRGPESPQPANIRPHPLFANPHIYAFPERDDRLGAGEGPPRPSRYRPTRPQSHASTPRRHSLGDVPAQVDVPDNTSQRTNSLSTVIIPTWAKRYYSNGGHVPLSGIASPASETTEFPNIGRNPLGHSRLREQPDNDENRRRGTGRGMARRPSQMWSPRLQPNRRQTTYSVWEAQAPQLPDNIDGGIFSLRGLQMVMFCVGFIIPIAWMIGAVSPLPPNPRKASGKGKSNQSDIESWSERDVPLIDEIRYENVRWWRNVNRIMSIAGVLIIGAIIAMVAVAERMQSERIDGS